MKKHKCEARVWFSGKLWDHCFLQLFWRFHEGGQAQLGRPLINDTAGQHTLVGSVDVESVVDEETGGSSTFWGHLAVRATGLSLRSLTVNSWRYPEKGKKGWCGTNTDAGAAAECGIWRSKVPPSKLRLGVELRHPPSNKELSVGSNTSTTDHRTPYRHHLPCGHLSFFYWVSSTGPVNAVMRNAEWYCFNEL